MEQVEVIVAREGGGVAWAALGGHQCADGGAGSAMGVELEVHGNSPRDGAGRVQGSVQVAAVGRRMGAALEGEGADLEGGADLHRGRGKRVGRGGNAYNRGCRCQQSRSESTAPLEKHARF